MSGALRLARRGLGRTAPNPAVGAVVFDPSNREILGRGWTQPGGRPHAEPEALGRAGPEARGATLYVTLEPCAHHGRTPPCTSAIIAAGIGRVVCGILDPDPRVAGQGVDQLRAAGIEVISGVCAEEARRVTLGHVLRVSERRPFVQLKIAVGPDGSVPQGRDGQPAWVTGPLARLHGHLMRAESDAILVGSGTARDDNPSLDCRLPGLALQSPMRVVISTAAAFDTDLKLFAREAPGALLIIAGRQLSDLARQRLEEHGANVITVGDIDGRLWIPAILEALVDKGVTRLLVEGGPAVWQAFDRAGMIDEVVLFRGGKGSSGEMDGAHEVLRRYVSLMPLRPIERRKFGDDDMIVFRP